MAGHAGILTDSGHSLQRRLLLHIPVGLAMAWLSLNFPLLAVFLFLGFLVYELDQDWRIKDKAYKDIAGALWGICIGGLAIYSIRLLSALHSR